MQLIEQFVRFQYKLLGHEGFYTRVRWDDKQNPETAGKREDVICGVESLIKWAKPLSGKYNLYLSRNPFDKDGKPIRIASFTVDIDVKREPKDRATTEAELLSTINTAKQLNAERLDMSGVLCTSGNGALIIVPFESVVEDVEEYTKQAQDFEKQLIKIYSTKEVRIDATNYSKALVKLLGSVSTKGDPSLHRYAKPLGPLFFRRSDRVLQAIRACKSSIVSVPVLQLPYRDSFPSRSEADHALASRMHVAGLDPSAAFTGLMEYGWRKDDNGIERDYRRIISKIWGQPNDDSQHQLHSEPLWTPDSGFESKDDLARSNGCALSTGFKWLDEKLFGGYLPGRVYAIEAPTNLGKSTYAVQAAYNCCRSGYRTLFIATEMDKREFNERYFALGTEIPASKVLCGSGTGLHESKLAGFIEELKGHKLWVRFSNAPKIEEIEKDIENVKPDIVIYDYFQHMDTGAEHRPTQLGNFARWFENTAIKYDIPLIVTAQLHEYVDFKSGERLPANKTHLKDCKVLNDTAKVVIVLDWDKAESGDGPVTMKVDLQKNKGPMGFTKMLLNRTIPRFEEI